MATTQTATPSRIATTPYGLAMVDQEAAALRATTSRASPSRTRWTKLPRWLRRSGPRAQSTTEIRPTASTAAPGAGRPPPTGGEQPVGQVAGQQQPGGGEGGEGGVAEPVPAQRVDRPGVEERPGLQGCTERGIRGESSHDQPRG